MNDSSATDQKREPGSDTAGERWPRRGEGFPANNVWFADVLAFINLLAQNEMMWLRDSDLKYLNVRIDTRSGHFVLSCDTDKEVQVERVMDALNDARKAFGHRPWGTAWTPAVSPASNTGWLAGAWSDLVKARRGEDLGSFSEQHHDHSDSRKTDDARNGIQLARAAIDYLTIRSKANDAWVAAQASEQRGDHYDNQRELFREAHMLSEREEDYRRVLADSVIKMVPTMEAEVRKVCKFSATEHGNGVIVNGSFSN